MHLAEENLSLESCGYLLYRNDFLKVPDREEKPVAAGRIFSAPMDSLPPGESVLRGHSCHPGTSDLRLNDSIPSFEGGVLDRPGDLSLHWPTKPPHPPQHQTSAHLGSSKEQSSVWLFQRPRMC